MFKTKWIAGYALASITFLLTNPLSAAEVKGSSSYNVQKPKVVKTKQPVNPGSASTKGSTTHIDDGFTRVDSKFMSLANEAPALLVYFNGAMPVYGLPGTNDDDNILHRTQLTGKWSAMRDLRSKLVSHGVFLDVYTTSAYADIRKGLGHKKVFVQSNQYTANFDTGRLGLWPGGIIHVTAQEREGTRASKQTNTGSSSAYYANTLIPVIGQNSFHFDEYYVYQQFTKKFSILAGKIPPLFLPDQTMFASSPKQDFANFNFGGANPMYTDYYNTTSWAGLAFYKVNNNLTLIAGALDPDSIATNFAKRFFKYTNVFGQANISYNIRGLPGQLIPAINWYNRPGTDYRKLSHEDKLKTKHDSLMLAVNASQYVYLVDSPKEVERKLGTGEVVRGLGFIARGGWGPASTNFIQYHANIAMYGAGLWDVRPLDRFGIGVYRNGINKHLRHFYNDDSTRRIKLKSENGLEAFYNIGITPAVSWTNSYTHIWHPTYAEIEQKNRSSNVFMSRLTITW